MQSRPCANIAVTPAPGRSPQGGGEVLFLAFLLLVSPASAQQQGLAGAWVVEARQEQIRCTLTGRATLTPQRGARYRVELSTHEVCESGAEWRSQQVCLATRANERLTIDCTVISATPSNYEPDDFVLTIRNDAMMDGALHSYETWTALWRRPGAALTS